MSRYFPHTPYAEDQPLSHTILTVHVLTRAVTTGTIIGAGIFGTSQLLQRVRQAPPPTYAATAPRPQLFLRAAGVSTAWTLGIVGVGLVGRMWGREEIEWKDRSWRLMENKGQLETDDWTYGGMAAGLAAAAAAAAGSSGGLAALGWKGALGATGSGSVLGLAGYMLWRYGVNRGKFPE